MLVFFYWCIWSVCACNILNLECYFFSLIEWKKIGSISATEWTLIYIYVHVFKRTKREDFSKLLDKCQVHHIYFYLLDNLQLSQYINTKVSAKKEWLHLIYVDYYCVNNGMDDHLRFILGIGSLRRLKSMSIAIVVLSRILEM